MFLKLALSNGKSLKVKGDFPYKTSPVGFRVLYGSPKRTAVVVGTAQDGVELELEFPDEKPITGDKQIRAVIDTANYYALLPWQLLFELLPAVFDWREEEYITLSKKPWLYLDRKSLEVLEYVKKKRMVKEEALEKAFGREAVKLLFELGFLERTRSIRAVEVKDKFYRLSVGREEALESIKRFKNRTELVELINLLSERRVVALEELIKEGFDREDIKKLLRKGILEEFEESPPYFKKGQSLRQEGAPYLKPLGKKSLIFGSWEKTLNRLLSVVEGVLSERGCAYIFCDSLELLEVLYEASEPYLGDRLIGLSSLQSQKEFIKNWFRVQEEEGFVALGSRLSLLAPFKSLNLLMVVGDTEPKLYNGVDLRYYLFELSKYYGANFSILCSFPPLSLCLQKDWQVEYYPPEVEVFAFKRKAHEVFTEKLLKKVEECLEEENLFLVHKKGYSYAYCPKCQWLLECPECGTLLSLSKSRRLICTSCKYSSEAVCHECGTALQELGFGIDRIVEELYKTFGERGNFRFDTVPRSGRAYDNVFVIHADNILSVPWFDSGERYFSYLWRAMCIAKKRLVLQTVLKENPFLKFLEEKDWEGFCKEELEKRQEEALPPYVRLIRAKTDRKPDLEGLPLNIEKRRVGKLWDMLIKVDRKHFSQVLRLLRAVKPIELEVV